MYSCCVDEEKREAKAKKAEEKLLRQGGNRKFEDVAEAPQASSGYESEPPALDPIPKTEPISVEPDEQRLIGPAVPPVEESEPPALDPITKTEPISVEPDEQRLIGPAVPPVEQPSDEPTTTIDTKVESIISEERATSIEPVSTSESTIAPIGLLTAELIAQRVVSAPVDNEGTKSPLLPELLASATGTQDVLESTPATLQPSVPAAAKEEPPVSSPTSSVTKPAESLTSRIGPSITSAPPPAQAQPSSKTTVTAGQPKSESKVSSWLKTKFRRSSKPAKPSEAGREPISESAPSQEKGFIGGANLAAASNTSVNRSGTGNSEHEVAMAGKSSATASAPITTSADNEDLYGASPAAVAHPRRSLSSSSISSLSSSEGEARGRPRLPREPKPIQHNLRTSLRGKHPVGPIVAGGAVAVDPVPAAKGTGRDLDKESSDEEVEEQFEEARDTFDSEVLKPPRTLGDGGVGRGSDSPVRDSKFSEDL